MCIIIAKEKNGRLPKEEELKRSFEYNSDGAGFMYVDNGEVVVDKGYMTWNSFIGHYEKLLKRYNNFKDKSLVIHCRIGTSGKNTPGNTHPYPISDNAKVLRKKHFRTDIAMAHNGIIKNYGTPTGLNDTQEFIKEYLYPVHKNYKDFYENNRFMEGLKEITGSKLVFLTKEDKLYFVGEFVQDNGLSFSNTTYKLSYSYSYKSYYDNDWYDYYYDKQESTKHKNVWNDKDYFESYFLPLESNWYVDMNGNGDYKKVGTNDYWYDLCEEVLYEYKGDDFKMISDKALVYDENYEEVI